MTKVFSWLWIIILFVLWLLWTGKSVYTFFHWFSFHHTEKRRFWVKHGRPMYIDDDIWKTWIAVHMGTLFLASFGYFLFM